MFIIGLAIRFFAFVSICLVTSPPPHVHEGENFLDDERFFNSVSGVQVEPAHKVEDNGGPIVRVDPVSAMCL